MAFAPGGWRKLVRAGAVATLTFVAAAAAVAAPIPAPGDRLMSSGRRTSSASFSRWPAGGTNPSNRTTAAISSAG